MNQSLTTIVETLRTTIGEALRDIKKSVDDVKLEVASLKASAVSSNVSDSPFPILLCLDIYVYLCAGAKICLKICVYLCACVLRYGLTYMCIRACAQC